MATLTGDTLDALRAQLKRTAHGTVRVIDAQVEPWLDGDGEEYIKVTLVVSEPPTGQQTWSLEDAFEVRQRARQIAAELGVAASLAITMTMSGESGTEDITEDADDPTLGDGE